jgi:hypothetical protein
VKRLVFEIGSFPYSATMISLAGTILFIMASLTSAREAPTLNRRRAPLSIEPLEEAPGNFLETLMEPVIPVVVPAVQPVNRALPGRREAFQTSRLLESVFLLGLRLWYELLASTKLSINSTFAAQFNYYVTIGTNYFFNMSTRLQLTILVVLSIAGSLLVQPSLFN